MQLVVLLQSPYLWLALSFAGILFCGWKMDKAGGRLGIERPAESEQPPRVSTLIKNCLIAAPLVAAILYLFHNTSFQVALAVLFAGSLYYWRHAYKRRVRPLVSAGLTQSEALAFTFMQLLWLAPLTLALALFIRSKYGAP